ncbi:MAG: isopentenyl-diphosphate Delta-isomerase [Phycisphaerales bacterium]
MSPLAWIMAAGAMCALLALVMCVVNLSLFRPARDEQAGDDLVSVCIPARDEEANIEACVRAALASEHGSVEVLVYDDESTDRTPEILTRLAAEDGRVRAVPRVPLPEGWNGKQHACHRMSEAARGSWMLFTDADVRLEPDAVRRALAFAKGTDSDLVSTFPRQIVGSVGELLLVPMMFFVLLSYLPFARMRTSRSPGASAGCGQFLFARAEAYRETGGHAAFKDSMHDGIMMPRAFRRRGFRTDLFDGTRVCSVRMYRGWRETWRGFAKNAFEGLGSVVLLSVISVMHLFGHVIPWVVAPVLIVTRADDAALAWSVTAVGAGAIERVLLAVRFRHSVVLALLHPISIVAMTAVQWWSYVLHVRGERSWRGRTAGGPVIQDEAAERVVIVDKDDTELGTESKIAAHKGSGVLHRAFSVFVFDSAGRVMLQQRAASKYHFGGLWTNTCCGHPRPGERVEDAGARRLDEEMGFTTALERGGSFLYEAHDAASGLSERELDHVLIGVSDDEPRANPHEADGWRRITPADLDAELREHPERFTPWFARAWAIAREASRVVS